MRKLNKLISLLLAVALLLGVAVTFPPTNLVASAAEETIAETEKVAHPASNVVVPAIKADDPDNQFGGYSATNQAGKFVDYLVTDPVTGNQYVDLRTPENFTSFTGGYYMQFFHEDGNVAYQKGTAVVVSFDVFVENAHFTEMTMLIASKDSAGQGKNGAYYSFNDDKIKNALTPGQWNRITVIGQVREDGTTGVYLFVNENSLWMGKGNGVLSSSYADGDYFAGFQLGFWSVTNTDHSTRNFAVDNVYVEVNSTDNWAATQSGSYHLSNWADRPNYAKPVQNPVAKANGEFVDAAGLAAALANGEYLDLELYADLTTPVGCPCKIKANGYAVPAAADGYLKFDNGDGTYTYVSRTAHPNASNVVSAIKVDDPNNDFAGYSATNHANKPTDYLVTDPATGNQYIDFRVGSSFQSTQTGYYVDFSTTNEKVNYQLGSAIVISFDVFIEEKLMQDFYLQLISKNASDGLSETNLTYRFSENNINVRTNKGQWNRFTLIVQVKEDGTSWSYLFINDQYTWLYKQPNAVTASGQKVTADWGLARVRLGMWGMTNLTAEQNVAVDNVYIDVNNTDSFLTGLASGTQLTGWENKPTYAKPIIAVAKVDGELVTSADALNAALAGGDQANVVLYADLDNITVSRLCTITANGCTLPTAAPGYRLIDNGDGTYTCAVEDRVGNVVVNLNGEEIMTASFKYGTDLAAYLKENYAYLGNFLYADGVLYANTVWDTAPTTVNAEETVYNVTATPYEFTGDFVAIDKDGNISPLTTLDEVLTAAGDYVVVLNADITLGSATVAMNQAGKKTVYLQGNTLFAGGPADNHAFNIQGTAGLTLIGGQVVDNIRNTTTSIFFINSDFTGEVKLVNVDVKAVARVAQIRSGTFTVEGGRVYVLASQACEAFTLENPYNTVRPCTVNLIDTDVTFIHFSNMSFGALVVIQNTNNNNLAHKVNISGCNINLDFNAPLANINNPYASVNVDNTVLNVQTLVTNATTGKINVGKNVVSATSLKSVAQCVIAEGLEEVRTGKAGTPYVYTDEYATVTWSDGTTEKWADGSYPVNPDCKKDAISKVTAGETYDFTEADFALGMKANVTLTTNLVFNIYIPTSYKIEKVTIGGVEYGLDTLASANNVECYHFEYELAPSSAAAPFTLVVTLEGGTVVAREMSFVEYAELVLEQYATNEKAVTLVKSILYYIYASHKTMGNYNEGIKDIESFDTTLPETSVTGAVSDLDAIREYIQSAYLDLSAAPKWVFKLAEGVSGEGVVFTVDGVVYEALKVGDTLVLELPAYDMLDTITITVGEAEGQYNFADYYEYMNGCVGDLQPSIENNKAGDKLDEAEAYFYMRLLDAFNTYAAAAAAYKG